MIFLYSFSLSSGLETLPRGTWIAAMGTVRWTQAGDHKFCELHKVHIRTLETNGSCWRSERSMGI